MGAAIDLLELSGGAGGKISGSIRIGEPYVCANSLHPQVSAPTAGRLTFEKLNNYKLNLAAIPEYLHQIGPLSTKQDLRHYRMIGYIPDMIFDKKFDYLSALGVEKVPLVFNSVSVQFNAIRQRGGLSIVHDFALPTAPELRRVFIDEISLTRSFYLVRRGSDRCLQRLNRFAEALGSGLRAEIANLEALCVKI